MCGIVGAVSRRNIVPILIEGLRKLEYRGYDSAGVALVGDDHVEVALIPTTMALTTLGRKGVGDRVNVEVDILGKYVQRTLALGTQEQS